jgi:hypothetical protein
MEKRINKKINEYIFTYKQHIKDQLLNLSKEKSFDDEKMTNLIQVLYDYPTLMLNNDDFQKRKRVKNVVPLHERCCALKAANEQCTRRRKNESDFCGTHIKGVPHGVINSDNKADKIEKTERTMSVTAHDFNGIIYFIDDKNNVYDSIDIQKNKHNPRIIAKYVIENEQYKIPEFNI